MRTSWIIGGLLALGLLILMNLAGPLKGSSNSDFPDEYQPDKANPLPACPGSPNCIRLSINHSSPRQPLFSKISAVLEEMNAETIDHNSQSFQINAVFRIPVTGFRDDFTIQLSVLDDFNGTILHILSRSRVGRGDLGVNRRRISAFLKALEVNF